MRGAEEEVEATGETKGGCRRRRHGMKDGPNRNTGEWLLRTK